ncbi:MAG: hypothetical protein ABI549_02525 [Flavobacterium sp.]|uniref:hypothetical protein n=1 Tax=Flavobacterium sp. TaxID=239 RepID=UPI0032647217
MYKLNYKFLGIFTLFILIISCKNDSASIVNSQIDGNIESKEVASVSLGDSLISQSDFVNKINSNIDFKEKRATISKIKYDFNKYTSWTDNTTEEKQLEDIGLKFKKESQIKNDADIYINIGLIVSKNNKQTDKLTVYKQENYAEALVAVSQYFYVDGNLNLWTLGIEEDEEGIYVKSWNQYKIEKETGKIKLVKENIKVKKEVATETSNNWTGKYFFEKTNRDELKTSFNITINDLNLISLIYISDDEKPETYKNLKAEKLDDDKIKITFNKKYRDMGIIYIQKSENDYIISGDAISNINPGNDEYPLKRI